LNGGDAPASSLAAFGLSLITDLRPPGAWQPREFREPSLQILSATAETIHDNWSGREAIGWEAVIDGVPFVVERGLDGDYRFVHGAQPDPRGIPLIHTRAIHHLCADASVLRCAPSDAADPSWWRVVLDSVLFTVALLQGYETLHAGALAMPDGVIAITAATGAGKSTLLAELLGLGSTLMADDALVLEVQGSEPPLAQPAPPLMTVPAARLPALNVAQYPEIICSIEDERWIAVPVHPGALPLRALVVLDRRAGFHEPGSQVSLQRIERPLAPLLDSLMSFPRIPERQRARFELASALASTIGLWRLSASLETPPEVLADTLLESEL
jgi:hypothetical protein